MGKKVLVRSRFREPLVRTTRDWERGKDGKLQEVSGFRQFVNNHAYMTPKEAAFIVDSEENQKHIDSGLPPMYYYPAGAPLIVDEMKDGPLAPPLAGGGMIANNPQQAEAARKALAEGEASVLAREQQVAKRATEINASSRSGASKIARPDNVDDDGDKIDKSRPVSVGSGGGGPIRISNPDITGDASLPEPVTIK